MIEFLWCFLDFILVKIIVRFRVVININIVLVEIIILIIILRIILIDWVLVNRLVIFWIRLLFLKVFNWWESLIIFGEGGWLIFKNLNNFERFFLFMVKIVSLGMINIIRGMIEKRYVKVFLMFCWIVINSKLMFVSLRSKKINKLMWMGMGLVILGIINLRGI